MRHTWLHMTRRVHATLQLCFGVAEAVPHAAEAEHGAVEDDRQLPRRAQPLGRDLRREFPQGGHGEDGFDGEFGADAICVGVLDDAALAGVGAAAAGVWLVHRWTAVLVTFMPGTVRDRRVRAVAPGAYRPW